MKTSAILALGVLLASMMTACSGRDEGKSIADFSGASQSDSLSYFYGNLFARQYWQENASDSAASAPRARDKYLEGFKKGMEIGSNDAAYTDGVLAGLQYARLTQDIEKELGVKLSEKYAVSGVAYAMRSDTTVSDVTVQKNLHQLLETIGSKKDKENIEKSNKALAAAAKKEGLKKVNDGIYFKVVKPGTGPLLTDGKTVAIAMTMTLTDGKAVNVPTPESITVGNEFAGTPLAQVITQLHADESVKMLTSAYALFGSNCSRMNLQPTDIIVINLTTKGLVASANIEDANSSSL